jgi:hypothetical protein
VFGTQNPAVGLLLGLLDFVNFQLPAASLAGGSPPPSQASNWLTQLLVTSQADDPVDLGKTTGLKVKL